MWQDTYRRLKRHVKKCRNNKFNSRAAWTVNLADCLAGLTPNEPSFSRPVQRYSVLALLPLYTTTPYSFQPRYLRAEIWALNPEFNTSRTLEFGFFTATLRLTLPCDHRRHASSRRGQGPARREGGTAAAWPCVSLNVHCSLLRSPPTDLFMFLWILFHLFVWKNMAM